MSLKNLKEDCPVQLAEYSTEANISIEPFLAWWVPNNLKKRNSIITNVKYKYWLKTHKFGIKVPKNMNQEIEFDCENGNKFW